MKKFFDYKILNLLGLVILIGWIFASGFIFYGNMRNNEVSATKTALKDATRNNANAVAFNFDNYIDLLLLTSDFFRDANYDESYFVNALNDLASLDDFSKIAIILPNGESYSTNGNNVVPASYPFTEQMKNKENFISDVIYDEDLKSDVVTVNVPLLSRVGGLIAYFSGIVEIKTLSEKFNKIFYDVGGYYHVIDSNGKYIAFSDSELIVDMDKIFIEGMSNIEFTDGYTAEEFFSSFKSRKEGLTKYKVNGLTRTAYRVPININNWVMYNVIPQSVIEAKIGVNLNDTIILIANIVLIFIILLFIISRSQLAVIKYAEEGEKNLRFVSEQTNKFIMEWNFVKDYVKITGNHEEVFNRNKQKFALSNGELMKYVYIEDVERAINSVKKLRRGEKLTEVKLRIRHNDGHYIWCEFSGVPIKESQWGRIFVRAIGFMENIDEQEKESALLKQMSELDSLTQVFNKGTTEELIENIIAGSDIATDSHSLMIIDLDNFKSLNDTFGHQKGDLVIKDMANYLKNTFRYKDVVGRIGGDEFFVFMKDIKSRQLVVDKCEMICNHFNQVFQDGDKKVEISASIGVAFYPEHGSNFMQLYKNSDITLYRAKKMGKNNFQFYDGVDSDIDEMDYVSQRTDIDSLTNKE